MATSISDLFSGYVDPQQRMFQQQQDFQAGLGRATNPQQFIATVGSNLGSQLGNVVGMLAGPDNQQRIQQILNSVKDIQDPVEQAKAAAKAFADAGMMKEASMMQQRAQELSTSAEDRQYQQWKRGMEYSDAAQGISDRAGKIAFVKKKNPTLTDEEASVIANDPALLREIANPKVDTSNMGEAMRAAAQSLYGKDFNELEESQRKTAATKAINMLHGPKQGTAGADKGKPPPGNILINYDKANRNYRINQAGIADAAKYVDLIDKDVAKYGTIENLKSGWNAWFGKSTESDRQKANIRRFVTSSVNAVLNMAKGPQTDQDAQRARDQIMNGLDTKDPQLVRDGLELLKKTLEDASANDYDSMQLVEEQYPSMQGRSAKYKKPATPAATPPAASSAGKVVTWNSLAP